MKFFPLQHNVRFIIGMLILGAGCSLVYWAMTNNMALVLPAGIVSLLLMLVAAKVSRVPKAKD